MGDFIQKKVLDNGLNLVYVAIVFLGVEKEEEETSKGIFFFIMDIGKDFSYFGLTVFFFACVTNLRLFRNKTKIITNAREKYK